MAKRRLGVLAGVLVAILAILIAGCASSTYDRKARYAGAHGEFKEVDFDPFPGMNTQGRVVQYTPDELKGRIVWNLWTGDNAGFWDWLVRNGFGTADLLKVVLSARNTRFQRYGVTNQPGYKAATVPDQYGLLLDVPVDPSKDFDNGIDLATYGRSSGVAGLRIFPNPMFDEKAKAKWDPVRYLNDPIYYNDKNLVRPYAVGMTCSFCHIGPDPLNPPADPNEPTWANLNDYIGAQYFKVWEVFGNGMTEDSFVWQLLRSNPPGTLDTSFIATDSLNNPGTMNAIFEIPGRVDVAVPEQLKGGALNLQGVTNPQPTPRVLKDGADSVGFLGALSRVYLNIGEYWQEWLRHFNPLVGGTKQSPITVAKAQKDSPHWRWSEAHSPHLATYFTNRAKPLRLADAPGGSRYLSTDQAVLNRGKLVYARHCAQCHSSKQPPRPIDPASAEGTAWFEREVMKADFLERNFLGNEVRYPVTLIRTNATRAVAKNALRGHVWDNFSSETYKTLPGVGAIDVWDPFTKQNKKWTVPAGGRGYYRPPSLISMWATAPYLHHNALGEHVHDPSVEGRMRAFDDAVTKLLWPEKRLGEKSIWRTTATSWIQIPKSYVPRFLRKHADEHGNVSLGPIPKGTPINLLANTNLNLHEVSVRDLGRLALHTISALKDIHRNNMTDDQATQRLLTLVPDLYKLNSCPDFIEDKGHYFGTDLTDGDKRALIEFLKYL